MFFEKTYRGSRQKERADHIVRELHDDTKARWSDEGLFLNDLLQYESLDYWIRTGKIKKGTTLGVEQYRQDCNCIGEIPKSGRKVCQGHKKEIFCDLDGQNFLFWIEKERNDRNCNGVSVCIDGIQIGCR